MASQRGGEKLKILIEAPEDYDTLLEDGDTIDLVLKNDADPSGASLLHGTFLEENDTELILQGGTIQKDEIHYVLI